MRSMQFLALSGVLLLGFTPPVFADRDRDGDRDDARGHGRGRPPMTKFENNEERYRYEYKDRNCKYKYEYNYKNGKTKIEEKGDCRRVAIAARPVARAEPPPRVIPPAPPTEKITCNRELMGVIIGGAIGAGIGTKIGTDDNWIITTAGGAVIGAVIGGAIGRAMDKADHACVGQALEYAQLNQPVTWNNPAQNASFTVTPTRTFKNAAGNECRKYALQTLIGGQQQNAHGDACRQPDGSWRPVS